MTALDPEEVARLLAEASAPDSACTGLAASWCPVCGDCTCPEPCAEGENEAPTTYLEDAPVSCPLHGSTSRHADTSVSALDALRDLALELAAAYLEERAARLALECARNGGA